MDWNKARDILIAMFLIINIFLSYHLYTISRNQYTYISKEDLKGVVDHLKTKNIQVQSEIPDRVLIAPSVRVKYNEFVSKEIGNIFFDSDNYKLEGTAASFTIYDDNISIGVKNRINLTYNDKSIAITQTDVNEDKCLNNAYSFVSKLKLNSGNRYVKQKIVEKGYIRLILGQQFNNIPVETSEIEIYATEEGVVQARVSWFEWIKNDKKHNIITPIIALLKAYEEGADKENPVVVQQIRQGYYYNPATGNDAGDVQLEGLAAPMWVIKSNRGEIYINAYNENIESKR